MKNQLEELLVLKENIKKDIVLIIKEEWSKSKLGIYFEENTPDWIKEITPANAHPMNNIAAHVADRILNIKIEELAI